MTPQVLNRQQWRIDAINRLDDIATDAVDRGIHPEQVIRQDYLIWYDHFVDGNDIDLMESLYERGYPYMGEIYAEHTLHRAKRGAE
jgi:hypothetical protein